jgi:hypothetical protein
LRKAAFFSVSSSTAKLAGLDCSIAILLTDSFPLFSPLIPEAFSTMTLAYAAQ